MLQIGIQVMRHPYFIYRMDFNQEFLTYLVVFEVPPFPRLSLAIAVARRRLHITGLQLLR